MRCFVSYLSFVCFVSALAYVSSAPAGSASVGLEISGGSTPGNGGGLGGLTNILSDIDLPGLLRGVNSFVKLVGLFCPPLSQVLDNVIQNVTSTAFRIFGRAILQGGGLGGGSSSGDGGQKVSVVLPTFPPDDDDYEDEEESTDENVDISNKNGAQDAPEVSTTTESTASNDNNNNNSATSDSASATEEENNIAKRHTRVVREADDQVGAESAPSPQELSDVDVDEDQDRDKRYSAFGAEAEGHGGGSGNFLFDIIRLVAGSGATEEVEEKETAPGVVEVDVHKHSDTEGVPGPITRLFVIANRGIANLVQDLILRLAQTSEKLVNFKARLITSLI